MKHIGLQCVQWCLLILLTVANIWIVINVVQLKRHWDPSTDHRLIGADHKYQNRLAYRHHKRSVSSPLDQDANKIKEMQQYCLSAKEYCPDGMPGPIGPPGDHGPKGQKGERGAQGLIGVRGYPGPKGDKGDRGIDGRDGLPGQPGIDGINGRVGMDGRAGKDGKDGIPGRNGRDGLDGKDGLPGPPGLTGPPGEKGEPGLRGFPGQAGRAGKDGTPGIVAFNFTEGQHSEILHAQYEKTLVTEEGMSLSLNCSAYGIPKPSFFWQRTDQKPILMNGAHYVFGHGQEVLTFSPLLREHFGEYECSANNGLVRPLHRKINVQVTFRPEIIVPNAVVKATNGSNAVFDCIVEAFPEFTYEWQFNGRLLTNETKAPSVVNQAITADNGNHTSGNKYALLSFTFGEYQTRLRLVINKLDHHDYGTYQLRVRNLINVTIARLELIHVHEQHRLFEESTWRSFGVRNVSTCNCPSCTSCSCESCTPCRPQKCEGYDYVKVNTLSNYPNNYQLPLKRSEVCLKDGRVRRRLLKVGIPLYYTEFEKSFYGCWLKDGAPVDEIAAAKVWLTRENRPDLLLEYENVNALRQRIPLTTYTLRRKFTGNSQAIFAGYFYYNQAGGNWLIKYKLTDRHSQTPDQMLQLYPLSRFPANPLMMSPPTEITSTPPTLTNFTSLTINTSSTTTTTPSPKTVAESVLNNNASEPISNVTDSTVAGSALPNSSHEFILPLYKSGHNMMDILTDEHGLWIIYAWPQSNDTLVLKLDANQEGVPRITNAFEITLQRDYFGQAFISCGVLYLVDSVKEIRTKIELAIDLFNKTKVPLFDSNDEILDDLSLMSDWHNNSEAAVESVWNKEPEEEADDSYDTFDAMAESALNNNSLPVVSTMTPVTTSATTENQTGTDLESKLIELANKRQQLKLMKREGIEFINPFRNNKQISYNPTSGKLYAWDQNALIEYALLFNF